MNESEKPLIIYADYREEKSGIPRLIEESGLRVVRKNLSIGDYVISNEIVVERKSAYDFVHSLFDGRLFDQARRLREAYGSAIIIIEGNPVRLRRYRKMTKQIYAAISSLLVDYDIKIIYSDNVEHTAIIIESLARRLLKSRRTAVVLHKKPKLETIQEQQLYIIQSFPSIGAKTAEKILEYFGSLREFCNASISDLSRVEGIGAKKAEQIYKILNSSYVGKTRQGRKRRRTLTDYYVEEQNSSAHDE